MRVRCGFDRPRDFPKTHMSGAGPARGERRLFVAAPRREAGIGEATTQHNRRRREVPAAAVKSALAVARVERSAATAAGEASEAEEGDRAGGRQGEVALTELDAATLAVVVADLEEDRGAVGLVGRSDHELAELDLAFGIDAALEVRRVLDRKSVV